MAADVQIPPHLGNIFSKISDNLSDKEKSQANQIIKQRYGEQIDLDEKDFFKTQKELFRLGIVNAEEGLSFVSRLTKNASKKEQIQGFINEYKPDESSKFLGRERDKEYICDKLSNVKTIIPGFNLFGPSGVGKTKLAQEIAKSLSGYKAVKIDLKDIADISNVFFHILNAFELQSWDKDKQRILSHLKSKLEMETLLVLDNIEQLLDGSFKEEFQQFVYEMVSSEACKTGTLKILLTSVYELQDKKLKGKYFSDYSVKRLSQQVSRNLISSPNKQILKEEEEVLSEIAKLCNNLPYLLNAVKQLMREGCKDASYVLKRLKSQIIEKNVPEKYVCILEQFESIPNDQLKHLAVKISLLRRPFSVETAMKIAGLPLTHDNIFYATIDIELLSIHKVISKVDEKEPRYDIHSLFQEFVKDYLCQQFEDYRETYSEGEKHFFQHFSGHMMQVAHLLDSDFVEAFNRCETEKANFELAIDISKTNNDVFDILLHSDEHNELALVGILFEVLKDYDERKNLFQSWAEMAEKSGRWLDSVNLRSWQAMQAADLESRKKANQALEIAEKSLKKAQEIGATPEQLNAAKSLILHSQGRLQWQEATQMAISSNKHQDKKRLDLIRQGLSNLEEALELRKTTSEERNTTMKARTLNLIGNCYMELNEPDKAEGIYQEAMEMKRQLIGSDLHWEMPTYYNQIAQVHERRGLKIEKSYGGFLDFFLKSKYKAEYIKSVEWMKKALKLEEDLGVGDTEHTQTFQRNLANSLIGIGEYEEALDYATKCYEARQERYGEHPETVNILYLIGIIHEYRKDRKAAYQIYEQAFEMEEKLPHHNHSRSREKIRDRLQEMYRALKMKEEEVELQYKIEEITDQEDNFASIIPFQEKVYFNVNEQGGTYDRSIKGFVLFIPENCVFRATRITCDINTTLPTPASPMERLVSSVVGLRPSTMQLEKPLEITMLHCGPEVVDGYENIVKVFDDETQVWQEVNAIQEARPPPVKLKTDFINVQLTKLTAVAVVTRLITDTFDVTVDGCDIQSSWCSDIKLHFPEGAVGKTVTGQMQVLPIPNHLITGPEFVPFAVLLFHGFKDITFNKPVIIDLPVTDNPKKEDIKLLRTRLDDTSSLSYQWEDITNTPDVSQIIVKENKVQIQIKKFCALCLCKSVTDVDRAVSSLNKIIDNPPRKVSFAAYQHREPSNSSSFQMKLTCVANNKQLELTKELKKQGYLHLEDSTADYKMRIDDRAYINVVDIDPSKWRKNFFLQFLGEEECRKPFKVKTVDKEVDLEFYRQQNLEGDILCELPLKKVEQVRVEDNYELTWVEYCGIEFDALRDLPEGVCFAVLPLFSDHDRLQDRIGICANPDKWNDGGVEEVLTLLYRVSFDDVYKALDEMFSTTAPENTYLPSLLKLLHHGHSLTNLPLNNTDSEVRATMDTMSTKISMDSFATFGRGLGLSDEVLDTHDAPSKVLKYWCDNYTDSTIADLFNALRACAERGPAKELAKTITNLSKTKQEMKAQLESSV